MPEEQGRSLKMLAVALEMEEKGRKYYEKAAATCQNPLGREVFGLLRDYEVAHMDRIREIHRSLEQGAAWSEEWTSFELQKDLGAMFRELVRKQAQEIRAETSDVEALKVGLELESASVKFYEERLAEAADAVEQRFLELMLVEEREHLLLLSDMRYYYEDPEGWFLETERAGLDGA